MLIWERRDSWTGLLSVGQTHKSLQIYFITLNATAYRIVREDLRNEESVVFGKFTIVEDEQELSAAVETLNAMWNATTVDNQHPLGQTGKSMFAYGGKNQTSPLETSSMKVSPFSLMA